MNRRRFLELAAFSSPLIAGCTSQPGQPSETDTPTDSPTDDHTATSTFTASPSDTPNATEEPTPTSRENPDTIFVGPDGGDGNPGTEPEPLASIQTALDRAGPGETIYVKPGEYREESITRRRGEPGNPITITGPPDAVVRQPESEAKRRILDIVHSHIHLTGLTLNGLAVPADSQDPEAYSRKLINIQPPTWEDSYPDYLTDIQIKPHAIGNARYAMVGAIRTNDAEFGEFEIIGPAGTKYLYGDESGHNGEIVLLGTDHTHLEADWYPWDEPDLSHNNHVHHIANLAGYSHTELVEVNQGMYDVTIEYCTDLGGSGRYFLNEDVPGWEETAMGLGGSQTTLRWNVIENGFGSGIQIGTFPGLNENLEYYEDIPDERFPGKHNAVYGNRIIDNESLAIAFPGVLYDGAEFNNRPEDQHVICGNEYNGDTQADPDKPCSEDIPETDTIGHLGGDSPWT